MTEACGYVKDPEARKVLFDFYTQILHNPIKFSIGGLLRFEHKMMASVDRQISLLICFVFDNQFY